MERAVDVCMCVCMYVCMYRPGPHPCPHPTFTPDPHQGETATFEVDHTEWYDGAVHWWPHHAKTAPPPPVPEPKRATVTARKPCSHRKMPVVSLVCELGERV